MSGDGTRVVHILDPVSDGRARRLPTPRALYDRWERQQWSIAETRVARDRPVWEALRPFARGALMEALSELEVGEVAVTRTLSTLVTHAPGDADRTFLSTQVADEARHAQFFQDYLRHAAGRDDAARERDEEESAYGRLFEPRLRASVRAVEDSGGDRAAWHVAVIDYHLLTEGVLAAAALHGTRRLARRSGMAALGEGLDNVVRDESRHFTYGLAVTRDAVDRGLAGLVADTYVQGCRLMARVLVNPGRRAVAPVIGSALLQRARLTRAQWDAAEERALRQLRLIGLQDRRAQVAAAWGEGRAAALAEYEDIWKAPHPVAVLAAAPPDPA
ncbi:ribonucleotide-diphosphate reductase subunit beta [Actinomadura fibrosa]|uniref:Ribonucleotide-diphosphate reductase subunit beta n=1 Tax=Actinomadura fibrosa TaxID=111802 RepID=A0ABW2XVU6_9ACTN|nr:ribonucleotide-diphosphate reductase subunit beta [Actinomadura fibrosa]